MVAVPWVSTAPVPPPAYHRAQAQVGPALHLDALTLVRRLHLLALCRLAVRLAQRRCPPPVPAGPGGHPRVYAEESLLLLALLRTLWRLSYQDLHDWLVDWPALALACGLPPDGQGRGRVPSPAQTVQAEPAGGRTALRDALRRPGPPRPPHAPCERAGHHYRQRADPRLAAP